MKLSLILSFAVLLLVSMVSAYPSDFSRYNSLAASDLKQILKNVEMAHKERYNVHHPDRLKALVTRVMVYLKRFLEEDADPYSSYVIQPKEYLLQDLLNELSGGRATYLPPDYEDYQRTLPPDAFVPLNLRGTTEPTRG